jgi:integrative and conjugative element protein (TIGR02256 family)
MLPAVFGDKSDIASVRPLRAQVLAMALAEDRIAGARLVAVHQSPGFSALHVKLDVEVGQKSAKPIRPIEPMVISFSEADQSWPEVYALRLDFPRDLPHLTCNEPDYPVVGLCISEEVFDEAKVHWTPSGFIRQIQSWLARAAEETLHADDQQLDPVILRRDGELIVPHSLMTSADQIPVGAYQIKDSKVYFLEKPEHLEPGSPLKPEFACTRMIAPPRLHGVLFLQLPRTLKAFIDRLEEYGWETCRADIEAQVEDWLEAGYGSLKPLFLVSFPLLRNKDDKEESKTYHHWAIASSCTIDTVAIDLGLLVQAEGFTGPLIGATSEEKPTGGSTPIWHLSPHPTLSPTMAAIFNGLPESLPCLRTVVIGVGALGSQVLANTMKAGFLPSHIVDVDRLMPHNLARHELGRESIGLEKAEAMRAVAAATLDAEPYPEAIVADILRPGEKEAELLLALQAAELVVDLSASVAVSRSLAQDERYGAPRISMFLNQSGTDLIILAEHKERLIPLDQIEAQYYWAVATDPQLDGHLQQNERIRYGRSCRDLSGRISQAHVATLSGIASEMMLRATSGHELPHASVWRCNPDSMAVNHAQILVEPMETREAGPWTFHISKTLIRDMAKMRDTKLPNETGGCLVGMWDTESGVIHLVGALPAPPDSKATPTSFTRGVEGQKAEITTISQKTAGMLGYVGEWHSHPRWASTMPSEDDITLYGWMKQHMDEEGYPAVMLIIGDDKFFTLVVSGSPPIPLGKLCPEPQHPSTEHTE